jgi:hypothetical protein
LRHLANVVFNISAQINTSKAWVVRKAQQTEALLKGGTAKAIGKQRNA